MANTHRLHPRHDGKARTRGRRTWRTAGVALIALSIASFASVGGLTITSASADDNRVRGMDVASHQGNVDWNYWWGQGMRFVYAKATEGTSYQNPYFAQQYNGSYQVGMIRGAYHFALPDRSSGRDQANYFVDHGGGWSDDGRTLPGALDIEYNPYGATCYGKSASGMAAWIHDFADTYHSRTGRYPTIYSTTNWWQTCTGNAGSFGETSALWLARYGPEPGGLPAGWGVHTIWQYSSDPVDQNWFNGSYERLKVFAKGSENPPPATTAPPPPPTTTAPPPPPPSESPTTSPSDTAEPSTSAPAPGGGGGLPVTGSSMLTLGGIGALLLIAGIAMLVLGRPARTAGLHERSG